MSEPIHVHPAAGAFPMLSDDELKSLAADIKTNGQRHPIVEWRDETGKRWLIDGRNRLKACKLAGVDAEFVVFDGGEEDIVGYVVSTNLQQRHMTQGQRALVAARLIPREKSSGGELGAIVGVDKKVINEARTILEYAPNLVSEVLKENSKDSTPMPFASALLIAKENKGRGDKSVTSTVKDQVRLNTVRAHDETLATRVEAGETTLDEAYTQTLEDVKQDQEERRSMGLNLTQSAMIGLANGSVIDLAKDYATRADRSVMRFPTITEIERAADLLAEIANEMREAQK